MKVVVVGAGIAGLLTSLELIRRGIEDVVVVDSASAPGGIARTVRNGGFAFEPAVGSLLLPDPHLTPLLEMVGTSTRPLAASERYVFSEGRVVAIPRSPGLVKTPLIPAAAKVRALLEPLIPGAGPVGESLAGFCRRRFGSGAGDLLAWLMASGVYAGDPRSISAEAAFPRMTSLERESGSVLKGSVARLRSTSGGERRSGHVPDDGMDGLFDDMARFLGKRLWPRFAVSSVVEDSAGWLIIGPEVISADAVVIAANPMVAGALLGDDWEILLGRRSTSSVATVALGGLGRLDLPPGFGILVGPDEGTLTRGVTLESAYDPARAPRDEWLVKLIVGGEPFGGLAGVSDAELTEIAIGEAAEILKHPLEPTFVEIARHEPGIPQYHPGHLDWLRRIDDALSRRPGLHLTGWGYRGVGVANLASDAVRLAGLIAPVSP